MNYFIFLTTIILILFLAIFAVLVFWLVRKIVAKTNAKEALVRLAKKMRKSKKYKFWRDTGLDMIEAVAPNIVAVGLLGTPFFGGELTVHYIFILVATGFGLKAFAKSTKGKVLSFDKKKAKSSKLRKKLLDKKASLRKR